MRRKVLRKKKEVEKAADLYVRFRGEEPQYIEAVKLRVAPVMLLIGECDGLLYSTRRDGKNERYIHQFAAKSRPLLASSYDGKQLYLLGGAYNFTDAGIIDR